jgi:hypothetical protein
MRIWTTNKGFDLQTERKVGNRISHLYIDGFFYIGVDSGHEQPECVFGKILTAEFFILQYIVQIYLRLGRVLELEILTSVNWLSEENYRWILF